jgi:hypothetical protein
VVFGNLVENRICFKGDGGGGGADSPAPVTNPGSRERGRGAEPPAATGRNFSQASQQNQGGNNDRPSDNPATAAERNRNFGVTPRQASTVAPAANPLDVVKQVAAQSMAQQQPMTDRQMLAASAQAPNPFAAPSAGVTPSALPGSGNAQQAAIVEALVRDAAQQSLDQGGATKPVSAVMGPAGRQDPGSGFFADAYDDLYGGTAPGTALGTILGAGPVSGLFGGNTPDPADAAAFNVGQLERMGGVRDPQTGAITGAMAGPGTLNMNRFGMVTYSGVNDPNYTGPFQNLVRGTTGLNGTENDRPSDSQMAMQPAAPAEPVDPGTTTPEQIDDLAVNYLQNPFFLYSGQGNLFQPYGYAGNTLVDLLQTRNMRMPGQAAPNLGLFGNPRDFS